MEKKEFLDASREYFKSIGFQTLKKSKFYYYTDDLALLVWLQHSDYSEMYYINYDIQLKALHPNEQCDGNICDVRGRLACSTEYQLRNAKDYLLSLERAIQKQIAPIMKDGLVYVKQLVANHEKMGEWCVFAENNRSKILSL